MVNVENYKKLISETGEKVILVAVSKTKPAEAIKELYGLGHRDFGENYVQELVDKQPGLPQDIRWHYIGHLQTNKVKYIAPFVHLIHGVDSLKLLKEINKQGEKNNRVIDCLLQVHIAQEETKFGLDEKELNLIMSEFVQGTPSGENLSKGLLTEKMANVSVRGLMGMASFSDDLEKVRTEFRYLKTLFDKHAQSNTQHPAFNILSMGMSADYKIAIEEGSNMVRIGSLLFGERS